jgi:hypothetical protein
VIDIGRSSGEISGSPGICGKSLVSHVTQGDVGSARMIFASTKAHHLKFTLCINRFSKPIRQSRVMDLWLEMLLHSIDASKPPTNYQEIAVQESTIGIPLSIGDQLAILDDHMKEILKTAPRQRSNNVDLPRPNLTPKGATDNEKLQHRKAIGREYAHKARQKKKDHQHNMAVENQALQEENTQLKSQLSAILVSLAYDTSQINHT